MPKGSFIAECALGVVSIAVPYGLPRPLANAANTAEPFANAVLVETPSAYSSLIVGFFMMGAVALPLMCNGRCLQSCADRDGRLAKLLTSTSSCAWLLALLFFVPCLIIMAESYFYDGFFFFINWSMVFKFSIDFEVAAYVDAVQVLMCIMVAMDWISMMGMLNTGRKKTASWQQSKV